MEKMLIIQLTRMGDSVQTLPVLKRLKQASPDLSITLLCVEEFSRIFKRTSFVDRIVPLPAVGVERIKAQRGFDGFDDFPELLEEYDSVVNLTHSWIGGYFAEAIRGRHKSGLVNTQAPEGRVKGDWAKYLFASQKQRAQNLFNLVDIHMGMAGVSPSGPVLDYPSVQENELDHAGRLLRAAGFRGNGRLIAIQLGANQLHRAWPPESFARLAAGLLKRPDVEIVLLGTDREKPLSRRFLAQAKPSVIDLVGKTRMEDLAPILRLCDFIVSNDTGTIHIAASVGATVLGLYFSTAYFAETAPYGQGNVILQAENSCCPCQPGEHCPDAHCIKTITVDAVMEVADRILDGKTMCLDGLYQDLGAYESIFLSNGTLVYAPIPPAPVSDRYLNALIWRSLWETALGVERDSAFLGRCFSGTGSKPRASSELEKISNQVNEFGRFYQQGASLARRAIRLLATPETNKSDLAMVNQALQGIEAAISSCEEPLLSSYHMLSMLDMEYTGYRQLVGGLVQVYSSLEAKISIFLGVLRRLSQLDFIR